MTQPDVITEFQRRRDAARAFGNKAGWWVALFFVGVATTFQDRLPWLPYVICGVSVAAVLIIHFIAREKLKCPACGGFALDPWRRDVDAWNPEYCHKCGVRLQRFGQLQARALRHNQVKLAAAIGLFSVVPLYLALMWATRGEFMPFVATRHPPLWNIQYLPWVLLSLVATLVSVELWRRWRPAATFVVAAIWNIAWFGLGLVAITQLWGEKV